jgi:PilZ domain
MATNGQEKRNKARVKQELVLKLKVGEETKQVYMIDLSLGGIKIGGDRLILNEGQLVEITIVLGRESELFHGKVERQDGLHRIKRISTDANSFFIRIIDTHFPEFVKSKFSYNYHNRVA